ncbi:MAG: DUF2218 domain-containing protein [Anaerolineae bacterium]
MKEIATAPTKKGARYMKALVNHFSRKGDATYEGNQGSISFGFGRCEIEAQSDTLIFIAEGETQQKLTQLEGVISSHLKRFMQDEEVILNWVALSPEQTA